MDILNNEPTERPPTPDPQCSICLNELTNKCYTNACVHLFCFGCLQSWTNMCLQRSSSSQPTCPLCKQTFRYIYHSFDNLGAFETYTVPITRPTNEEELARITNVNRMIARSIFTMDHQQHTRMTSILRSFGLALSERVNQLNHNFPQINTSSNPLLELLGQSRRIQVYVDNLWVVPVPNTDGRFRDGGTPAFYRNNPAHMYRLRTFVLRDLVAIRESVRVEGPPRPFSDISDFHATNLIMSSLTNCDIRQLHLLNRLSGILNVHAVHFCHELYNFADSIFDIRGYDDTAQYTHYNSELTAPSYQEQSSPTLIVLDSDNEELQRPNIIEDSSSTNSSDVEVVSDSFRSTDPLNSASINQPSTSTGIRDSLDRPKTNNSFQSVNGGLSQVSYPSQVKRGSPNSDESDDEESIIATQGSQTANLKSQDMKKKKKKKHQ